VKGGLVGDNNDESIILSPSYFFAIIFIVSACLFVDLASSLIHWLCPLFAFPLTRGKNSKQKKKKKNCLPFFQ
jgi:hypothetical protein